MEREREEMSNLMVENQTEQVSIFLEDAITLITNYVNYHTLPFLLEETPAGNEQYYKGLLASMRRLLVFCEEGHDACFVLLNSQPFRKTAAEKILYKIYHQVIAEFFPRRVIIGMKIVDLHIQEKILSFFNKHHLHL